MARRLFFFKLIRAKEERNGQHSTDQGLSTAKPRGSHATWAQCWNLPTSLRPALSADTESKSQGHCRKWNHKLKVAWSICASIVYNGLTVAIISFKTAGSEWCWLLVNLVNPTNQINTKNNFHTFIPYQAHTWDATKVGLWVCKSPWSQYLTYGCTARLWF